MLSYVKCCFIDPKYKIHYIRISRGISLFSSVMSPTSKKNRKIKPP